MEEQGYQWVLNYLFTSKLKQQETQKSSFLQSVRGQKKIVTHRGTNVCFVQKASPKPVYDRTNCVTGRNP